MWFNLFQKTGKSGKSIQTLLVLSLISVLLVAATIPVANWTSSGQSIINWRSQPLETSITPGNVASLTPMFSITTDGDVSATPNISGGIAYFPDWGGSLWAVNATTGAPIWKVKLGNYTGIPGTVSRTTPTSATKGVLLVGTQEGAFLLAINQRDGSLIWRTKLDNHPFAIISTSPSVFKGVAYLGVASIEEAVAANPAYPCCTFRGSAVAVDIATGVIKWKTYTVPNNNNQPGGYSGNSVWGSSPVVDPARNLVYLGTGNNYTAPACILNNTCTNDPANFTDAVLALDMSSGQIMWADPLMGLGSDAWNVACFVPPFTNCPSNAGPDYDFGQGPMKLKATINGKKVDILGIGQKSGSFWAVDPATGRILWQTVGGPGSALGGMEWGSATDGTRIYYAISNQYGIPYTLKDGSTTTGGLWGALDPATGAILWQTADPNGAMDPGAVSVANGVVYAGSMGNPVRTGTGTASTNPTFFALDAATGHILWSYVSGGSVNAGAAIANGVVYWGSGYGRFGLGSPNFKFFAFKLP
ncbi:MAG TPA: PQQ-binding-like beta-propeller repeat protein [Anaerolineales bacterium]|jgi:polyvinyl alcohol dehydrogenase (cytochrome)